MSLLNRNERAFIVEATRIDPVVVDRTIDAFDAMLRDDPEMYRKYMVAAVIQCGYPGGRIPPQERPSAVDRVRMYAITKLSKQWNCSFKKAVRRCDEMLGVEKK